MPETSEAVGSPIRFDPIHVRFDGMDAELHEIDLYEFGKSAQGLSKIIATVADFSVTRNYQRNKKNLCCKVSIKETKPNCFSFVAILNYIDASPTLTNVVSTVSGTVCLAVLAYVWCIITGKKDKEEMQAIKSSLDLAIKELGRPEESQRLLDTIEKMALALIPAAKNAVSPIGVTCDTIKFGDGQRHYTTLDANDKAIINGEVFEVGPEQQYRVLISELDMRKGTCKISLVDEVKTRYSAKITDPQIELANNKYAAAMAQKAIVTIKAKTKIVKEKIREFVVSDIS